jgi:hypothetical protein
MVHGPVMQAFGEVARVQYTPAGGSPILVDGIFDEGARPVRLVDDPDVNEVAPLLGVRLSQFPAGFNPRNAKDDTFVVTRAGVTTTYVVTDGKPDSHGWAQLTAVRQ